jgi:hypothetical protein
MVRLIRGRAGPPLVRKEISSQHPANVIISQPSPMVIREGVKLLFHIGQHVSTTHIHSMLNTTVLFNGSDGTAYTRLLST